jgi:nucleoside-diphosphate-sugar epimerase
LTRIIITGASGLIGKRLVSDLKQDANLVALGRHAPSDSDVTWIPHDFSKSTLPELPRQSTTVIYLAQSEHFRQFPERAQDIFNVNVAGVQKMLDWARVSGAERFILASSGGVYGHGDTAFREDDAIGPIGPLGYYLASKHCAELLAGSYANCLTIVILRFFFVFGPGQKQSMLIPRLIDSVINGRPITLQGNEGIRLNPIFVDDASMAIRRALELTSSHTINVAGPDVLSMRQIGALIGQAVGREPVFEIEPDVAPRHLSGDISKMCTLLVPPRVSFADGLAAML